MNPIQILWKAPKNRHRWVTGSTGIFLLGLAHARSCTSTSVWQLPIIRREMATGVRTATLLPCPNRVCNHLVQIGRRVIEPYQVRRY